MATWLVRYRHAEGRKPKSDGALVFKRWLHLVITDVPDTVTKQSVKSYIEQAGYAFGEFDLPWSQCELLCLLQRTDLPLELHLLLTRRLWDEQMTWIDLWMKAHTAHPTSRLPRDAGRE